MDAVNWSFRNFGFRILDLGNLKRISVGICNLESETVGAPFPARLA